MYALLLGALLGFAAPACATTVYKSVDANGKVTFSDQPPVGASTETIEIGDYTVPDSVETEARLRAMRETTDRLRDDRLERERQRNSTQPASPYVVYQQQPQRIEDSNPGYLVPVYRPRYPYRPQYPDHHPQPPLRPDTLPNTSSLSPRGLNARLRAAR